MTFGKFSSFRAPLIFATCGFCRGRGLGFQGGFGSGGPAPGYGAPSDRGGSGYGGGGYGGGPGGIKRDYDGGDDRDQKRMRY